MNRYLRTTLVSAAMCAVTLHGPAARAQPATGEGYAPGARVLTIVRIPTPWYAPRFLVVRRMRESMPLYQSIDGLMHKTYSLSRPDGQFGGIYLWKDLASARAWFTPAWFERVEKERGARGDVAFFEVVRVVEAGNGGPPTGGSDQAAVATLIEVGRPMSTDGADLMSAAATWQGAQGLLRTCVVRTPQGGVGAIALWRDEASARAWLNTEGGERIAREYGEPTRITWFETPILMPGKDARDGAGGAQKGAKP